MLTWQRLSHCLLGKCRGAVFGRHGRLDYMVWSPGCHGTATHGMISLRGKNKTQTDLEKQLPQFLVSHLYLQYFVFIFIFMHNYSHYNVCIQWVCTITILADDFFSQYYVALIETWVHQKITKISFKWIIDRNLRKHFQHSLLLAHELSHCEKLHDISW